MYIHQYDISENHFALEIVSKLFSLKTAPFNIWTKCMNKILQVTDFL